MSTAASRMRVLRAQQRAGRIILEIEVAEIEAAESLVIAGVLDAKAGVAALQQAEERVAWRKQLLAELDDVQKQWRPKSGRRC